MSLKEEDEMIEKQRSANKKSNNAKPLPIAHESGFIKKATPNPAPHIASGSSGGAIAAGVISVLLVILLGSGFAYLITRTRVLPRLRAHITNTPYEDIIINDRGQIAAQNRQNSSQIA
jgi:hypothetical protein